MTLKKHYFEYLQHFGQTRPVRELAHNPDQANLIALRHDVDYNIDLALEMAFWEFKQGIRSTYYLLHTTPYWDDPRLIDKCLQLQDFGHEVGLHINLLTEWITGKIDNPANRLEELLKPFREAGVTIEGVSAHGDNECYKHQYINYWCFKELRPENPELTEEGLSAEGIPVDNPDKQIQYPADEKLTREDGKTFPLWSLSMEKYGLTYDAVHTQYDQYFTDSGGKWTRSPDPLTCKLKTGRHQVLMHPIHWRDWQRMYFFLSTARSGSKWLSQILDIATPLHSRHEFSLNHRYQDEALKEEKRTGNGFVQLMQNQDECHDLLIESRAWIESFKEDYAEANVYLPHVDEAFSEAFPDATVVHLHRDPKDVVRSIMNRDWYDTPQDDKHPVFEKPTHWDTLSQFEKCCWYVRNTHQHLIDKCNTRLQFEKMVTDIDHLANQLHQLKIPFYPRLAKALFEQRINENRYYGFPAYPKWTAQQKSQFQDIMNPVNLELGYKQSILSLNYPILKGISMLKNSINTFFNNKNNKTSKPLSNFNFQTEDELPFPAGCSVSIDTTGLHCKPKGERHAYLLLGKGKWKSVQESQGWKVNLGNYYKGQVEIDLSTNDDVRLMCLQYDKQGQLLTTRVLGNINHHHTSFEFSFKPRPEATRFNLALFMSKDNLPKKFTLKKLLLEQIAIH